MNPSADDTSCWVIEESSPLLTLPALWKRAPGGSLLAFEGVGTRGALNRFLVPVDCEFEVFSDSSQDGTELLVAIPSSRQLEEFVRSIAAAEVCDLFYHFKIIDSSGRIWVWHHDACSGDYPRLNPRIPEALVAEISREFGCRYTLQTGGMWGWDYCLERRANHSPQPIRASRSAADPLG